VTPAFAASVYIGRFQPFHGGHLAVLRTALQQAPICVVVIGSAYSARSPKNPFLYAERVAMLEHALTADERARVITVPVRDYYNEARWARAVVKVVMAAVAVHGITKANTMSLVGHFKDNSSSYLHAFPEWQLTCVPRMGSVDAAYIRQRLFSCESSQIEMTLAELSALLPPFSTDFLRAWLTTSSFTDMREEFLTLAHYRRAWESAPYPPVFVTVDSVVVCRGHVLLIRRARAPGKGRYALPGGFIEQQETTYQAALRELHEETQLPINAALEDAFTQQVVFDHPARSLLGRVITHIAHFDLGEQPLPAVSGADDASAAEWITLEQLTALENQLHDDHFMVLDYFLSLLSD
jgi:bifunctional NMN adenylyltransferase/nudix hydrolase